MDGRTTALGVVLVTLIVYANGFTEWQTTLRLSINDDEIIYLNCHQLPNYNICDSSQINKVEKNVNIIIVGLTFNVAEKSTVEDCMKQHKLQPDAVKDERLFDDEHGKCYADCVFTKAGVIQGGKFNTAKAKEITTMRLRSNPDGLKKAIMVIDRCDKEVQNKGGKCDLAAAIGKCSAQHSKEMGAPAPSLA